MKQTLFCSILLTTLLTTLAIGARAAEPVVFLVEPEEGLTFSHTGELEAGSEILLEIFHLPEDQRFLASRCGEPCTTAETVFTVVGRDQPLINRSIGIEKTARYYFWVQRRDGSGATGPVRIESLDTEEDRFEVTFTGGATVRGRVRRTRDSAPAAEPRSATGDSVEILAVSPQPLTRGVPSEVTVDVRVTLESEFEATVGLGFNRDDPGRFGHVETRTVAPGTQQFTFITEVVPVDWGDRGRFAAAVHLLPAVDGLGTVRPLASDRESIEVVP